MRVGVGSRTGCGCWQEEQSNVSEMVLEVVSTITNWHGETDEAAAVLVAPRCFIVPGKALRAWS